MNSTVAARVAPEKQVPNTSLPAAPSFNGVSGLETRMNYSERLKDPRWQRRRLEILEQAGWSCGECGETEKTLHVDHKLYRKRAMPWEYEDHELQALCCDCHERITGVRDRLKESLANLENAEVSRILGYVKAVLALKGKGADFSISLFAEVEGVSDAVGGDLLLLGGEISGSDLIEIRAAYLSLDIAEFRRNGAVHTKQELVARAERELSTTDHLRANPEL